MYQQSRSQFIYLMKYLLLQNLFPHLDTLISSIAENTTPRIPTTIPKMVTATLHAICNQFNFFHFSFRWKTHGKMKHRLVPVKLPSRPITKPKWGTVMAKKTPNVRSNGRVRINQNQWKLESLERWGKWGSIFLSHVSKTTNMTRGKASTTLPITKTLDRM